MISQFIHLEEYGYVHLSNKRPSIFNILKEAGREPNYCKHVKNARRPVILEGMSPECIDEELRELVRNIKHNGRKIRKDSKVVIGGVASFPVRTNSINSKGELIDWCSDTLIFLKKEFGKSFKSAVLHMDEEYPHIHFYCYCEDTLRLDGFHPAYLEKKKEKVKRKKKQAFKKGLCLFLDRYHSDVSSSFGHKRYNKKRRRLDRDSYLGLKEVENEIDNKREELERLNIKFNKLKNSYLYLRSFIKNIKVKAKYAYRKNRLSV
ncbi:plasmid recombination protein [Alteromonas aestuariivivens]|nr:plasmid recombination protein [Alteromonas aestuariivivens]